MDILFNMKAFRKSYYGLIILMKTISYFLVAAIVMGNAIIILIILSMGFDYVSIAQVVDPTPDSLGDFILYFRL